MKGARLQLPVIALAAFATCCAWAQDDEAAEKVTLSFQDTPVQEAAREVGELLGRVVVVGEGVEGKVTLKVEIPKRLALIAVAASVGARPAQAVVFCSEDAAQGPTQLDGEKTVTLALTEPTKLSAAAQQLAEKSDLRVAVTPAVAENMVTYECEDAPLTEVLDALAKQAACAWVRGYVLVEVDPDKALADFSKLPPGQQEQLVNQGLDALDQTRLSPQQIDAMIAGAYQRFGSMSAEERKQAVAQAASRIRQMGGLLQGMSPETRNRVRAALTPFVERGVGFFVRLDAGEQAELMPLMEALRSLE